MAHINSSYERRGRRCSHNARLTSSPQPPDLHQLPMNHVVECERLQFDGHKTELETEYPTHSRHLFPSELGKNVQANIDAPHLKNAEDRVAAHESAVERTTSAHRSRIQNSSYGENNRSENQPQYSHPKAAYAATRNRKGHSLSAGEPSQTAWFLYSLGGISRN